jgi:site-specific DNA-methyltransferase (adenine-specific)
LGGGTTLAAADKLDRKWIGIDQSVQAVKVTEFRLQQQTDMFTNLYANSYTLQLHKYDYDKLRYADAFEFETWIIEQFGGSPQNKRGGDSGVDGKTGTMLKLEDNKPREVAAGTPIQVKRSEKIGVNVVKNFSVSAKQYNNSLFEHNKATGNPVGYIIAFSFSRGAVQEVARLRNREHIIIDLVNVDNIVPISKKPDLVVTINELSRDAKGMREIEFIAAGNSDAGIEFYSWDFTYNAEKGFVPSVIRDTEGKQTTTLTAGIHHIAVKAVDNNGLESIEVIKLKVNGVVERS